PSDTPGANLLVVSVSHYVIGASITGVSDNKGNTYTALTLRNNGTIGHRFYYAKNAAVGSGHTVTVTGSGGPVPLFVVQAFSGAETTAPFDVENGATTGGARLATGSVTPTQNNSIIVSGWTGF